MSSSSSQHFAYDFEYLLSGNEEHVNVPKRFQNLRYGAKQVLLLSPLLDDDEMPTNWPDERKMSVAPGALCSNQVVAFSWNRTEAKWMVNNPNFEGVSTTYQMYGAQQESEEDCIVLRQYCDPPRINNNNSLFVKVNWSKSLLSLSSEQGGVSKEHRLNAIIFSA